MAQVANGDERDLWQDIENIALPDRVVGEETHERVFEYLRRFFSDRSPDLVESSSHWSFEVDEFEDDTPFGKKNFRNIVAQWIPHGFTAAPRRQFVLAAHYDGKYFEDFQFSAATDSAVPCALILDAIRQLELLGALSNPRELRRPASDGTGQRRRNPRRGEVPVTSVEDLPGITIVLFDGEEAFVDWTATDSIYGARHLAARWQHEGILESIDSLILLDLLGGYGGRIYSYHEETSWLFDLFANVEARVGQLSPSPARPPIFQTQRHYHAGLQDDHIPFLLRGVPVLHLMPVPFPPVWHTKDDDISHLDKEAVRQWRRILPSSLAEILHLAVTVGAHL